MTAVMDSSLVSQCLAFCQTLASQGKTFNFKLTNTSFSLSVDTRESDAKSTVAKKRISPSTQRRNARRREEFLKRKLNPVAPLPSALDTQAVVEANEFKCSQCDNVFKSENGLKIHVGKTHKNVNTTPERLRQQPASPATMPTSPLSDARREEVGEEKEEPVSPLQPSPSSPIERCKNCDTELSDHWCCASDKMLCPDCCSDVLEVCDKNF